MFGIDATFLRTCKRIHEEAMPTLYGNNFIFSSMKELEYFRAVNLSYQTIRATGTLVEPTPCSFSLSPSQYQYLSQPGIIGIKGRSTLDQLTFNLKNHGRLRFLRSVTLRYKTAWGFKTYPVANGQRIYELGYNFPALQDLTLEYPKGNLALRISFIVCTHVLGLLGIVTDK